MSGHRPWREDRLRTTDVLEIEIGVRAYRALMAKKPTLVDVWRDELKRREVKNEDLDVQGSREP